MVRPGGSGTGLPFQIGASGPANQEAWPGRIDEVAIYGEALPAAAVAAVLFAYCPFVFARTAHIQLLLIGGLPFCMLALHRLVDDQPVAGVDLLADLVLEGLEGLGKRHASLGAELVHAEAAQTAKGKSEEGQCSERACCGVARHGQVGSMAGQQTPAP